MLQKFFRGAHGPCAVMNHPRERRCYYYYNETPGDPPKLTNTAAFFVDAGGAIDQDAYAIHYARLRTRDFALRIGVDILVLKLFDSEFSFEDSTVTVNRNVVGEVI